MIFLLSSDYSGGAGELNVGQQSHGRGEWRDTGRQRGAVLIARTGALLATHHTPCSWWPTSSAVSNTLLVSMEPKRTFYLWICISLTGYEALLYCCLYSLSIAFLNKVWGNKVCVYFNVVCRKMFVIYVSTLKSWVFIARQNFCSYFTPKSNLLE